MSTLLHAGHGLGRPATGVTALQVATVSGQALEPYINMWSGTEGNRVEKGRQISAVAGFRSVLLQFVILLHSSLRLDTIA